MKANRPPPASLSRNCTPPKGRPSIGSELFLVATKQEANLQRRVTNNVSHLVCFLSTLANDEGVTEKNPPRVIEAVQNYGHLLSDSEVEMLRDWLAGVH